MDLIGANRRIGAMDEQVTKLSWFISGSLVVFSLLFLLIPASLAEYLEHLDYLSNRPQGLLFVTPNDVQVDFRPSQNPELPLEHRLISDLAFNMNADEFNRLNGPLGYEKQQAFRGETPNIETMPTPRHYYLPYSCERFQYKSSFITSTEAGESIMVVLTMRFLPHFLPPRFVGVNVVSETTTPRTCKVKDVIVHDPAASEPFGVYENKPTRPLSGITFEEREAGSCTSITFENDYIVETEECAGSSCSALFGKQYISGPGASLEISYQAMDASNNSNLNMTEVMDNLVRGSDLNDAMYEADVFF